MSYARLVCRNRIHRGISLLEVLICIAVLLVVTTAIGSHIFTTTQSTKTAIAANQLNEVTAELAEKFALQQLSGPRNGTVWYIPGKGLIWEGTEPSGPGAIRYFYAATIVTLPNKSVHVHVSLSGPKGIVVSASASYSQL